MLYIKKLFLSLKEILFVMLFQYIILIGIILIFGFNKSIIIGTIILNIFEIIFILYKSKYINYSFNNNYFPYILLGLSISIIYNMTIFKYGIKFNINNNIPFLIRLISSSIIGPIFEEILFRYSLINKLLKFNSKKKTIVLGGIIFSLCHNDIVTIIYTFIIGLINSYIYIERKDIIIPIIIHMSLNWVSLFLFNYNFIIFILGIILFFISILCINKSNFLKK